VSSWGETNKNKRKNTIDQQSKMLELIREQDADVLCLQEFWDQAHKDERNSNIRILKTMGFLYSYYVKSYLDNKAVQSGVIILSKYPITDTAQTSYGLEDYAARLIHADILFRKKKIRIFTTHLQSVRFDFEEYKAIRKIKKTESPGFGDSKTIIRKLKDAYFLRGSEADLVRRKIKESPYPVIICGDFNDVPNSYTYFTIKKDMNDAFIKKGSGLGRTFQFLSPTLRIDYILTHKQFAVQQCKRIKIPYSDHYPVVADIIPHGQAQ